ncbi:hypothetical protein EZ449_20965 [Pedobacter frigidisoli]|uniref:AbiTii domain-containing protein n=1 Tax=Pedobacter frigidisoli TaxID=2530455 RepID=A0A4R0NK86_9SPHI|nr:hypothetical protein [Pedobacter frigidisoli]TCD00268.1 hypothetical protein EZ449_20965 [Pedobacter frigidisoli]
MKLISDIIGDLVDQQTSLVSALTKTKVLATRIGNQNLLEWVNFELKGYPNTSSLPEYRKLSGTIIGDFMNRVRHVTNYPIPLPEFGGDVDDTLREMPFLEGASTLELFEKNENPSLVFRFPDSVKHSLESILRNANGPYFQLLNIGVTLPIHAANQVLSAARDRLLDFILELEKQFGMETDLSELKKNNTKINYIMNNTITNNGDGNVVNTGENAMVNANITITKGNKDQLARTLRDNGVETEDVAELLTVIDTEQPEGSSFGAKVNGWMKKMLAKSIDGTWQISVGAAGNLLAEALKAYYS